MFYYHLLLCVYAIPSFNLQKNDSKSHFGLHLCLYPVLIIVVSLLLYTVMATPEAYAAAVAYFAQHKGELGVSYRKVAAMYPGVERNALFNRVNGRVLVDAKHGPRPRVNIAQTAEFKGDVQRGMHGNAISLAGAAAKIGAFASSNQLPYKDGVPCMKSVLHFFNDNDLGIAKARLLRTGRIQNYDWSKLEPAYRKLGEVFEKYPMLLSEPKRIANRSGREASIFVVRESCEWQRKSCL
jgi:hypothetical protein